MRISRRATILRAGCAVLLAAALAGCAGDGGASDRSIPRSSEPPATGSSAEPRALAIYYVGDTAAGFRLFREFHPVATADPASDAVRQMLATPPADPDYRSLWPAGTRLLSPVTRADGVITVDLSAEAAGPAQVGAEAAELTVQQLVFTVQAALQATDPVRVLVDGEPVGELWGHVALAEPVARADQYAVRSLVQIDSPAHGATVGPQVTVTGEAAVFEATVLWEVRRDGAVVRSGFTSSQEGQRFSPFRFTVALEPGEYEIRVSEDDPSGGEGRPPLSDTKQVTVTR
ncbi:GerMN domain-containing protein [Pseudonocardia sp. H11422]|uniref:GerMN domain-containing protein n=1 Tax=Pseudonocardia sp. H11422 TaxID=2835866 RepID=UPI001BDD2FAB|nr:Gmad2 immunoglobulin-like domain-containing protein [Pseudonocardia sp. H11422]